jgi:hypothetical protein
VADAPSDPKQDHKLARRAREAQDLELDSARPIARLEDPSTRLGLEGEVLQAIEQTVNESGLPITMRVYLKRFAKHGYKGKACASAGVTAQMPSVWRRHEEYGQEFAALEAVIQETLVEQLEESVDARAFLGYLEPVFGTLARPEIEEHETRDGKGTVVKEVLHRFTGVVGYKRMFDAQLAQFRLKALAPDKYAERRKTELTGANGGPVQIAPVVDRLSGQLARLQKQRDEPQDDPGEAGTGRGGANQGQGGQDGPGAE